MINLADLVALKFPNIVFMRDVLIQDDGEGPYIKEWNLSEPQPTLAELTQWGLELEEAYVFLQNKILNKPLYDQLEQVDIKSIRALRTNDIQRLQELEQEAQALRAQLLPTR